MPAVLAQLGGDSLLINLAPLIFIFAIMYFLIIRPQQQRAAQHRKMVSEVRRGDTVVTSGGVIGKVTRVFDESNEIQVEIAEGVRVRVIRSTLSDVRSKGEPVPAGNENSPAGK